MSGLLRTPAVLFLGSDVAGSILWAARGGAKSPTSASPADATASIVKAAQAAIDPTNDYGANFTAK